MSLLPKLYLSTVESVMVDSKMLCRASYFFSRRDLLLGQLSAAMCYRNIIFITESTLKQLEDLQKSLPANLEASPGIVALVNATMKSARKEGLLTDIVEGNGPLSLKSGDSASTINYSILFGIYSMWIASTIESLPNNLVTNTSVIDSDRLKEANLRLLPLGMCLADGSDPSPDSGSSFSVFPSVMAAVGVKDLSKYSFYCPPVGNTDDKVIDHSAIEHGDVAKLLRSLGEKAKDLKLIMVPITLPYYMPDSVNSKDSPERFINHPSDDYAFIAGAIRSGFIRVEAEFRGLFEHGGAMYEIARDYSLKHDEDGEFLDRESGALLSLHFSKYLSHSVEAILSIIDFYNLRA